MSCDETSSVDEGINFETQTDILTLLENIKCQINNSSKKQAFVAMATILNLGEESQNYFRTAGGLEEIVTNLTDNAYEASILPVAFFCLGCAVKDNEEAKMEVVSRDLLLVIHRQLASASTSSARFLEIIESSAFLLACLVSGNLQGQHLANDCGCVDDLLMILKRFVQDGCIEEKLWLTISRSLCACISNPQNENNQRISSFAIPHILKVVRECPTDEIVYHALTVMGFIVHNNGSNQKLFRSCGGIEALADLFRLLLPKFEQNDKNYGSILISVVTTLNLSVAENEQNVLSAVKEGVVAQILHLLQMDCLNPNDVKLALLTLSNLLEYINPDTDQALISKSQLRMVQLLTESETFQDDELLKIAKYIMGLCKEKENKKGEADNNKDTINRSEGYHSKSVSCEGNEDGRMFAGQHQFPSRMKSSYDCNSRWMSSTSPSKSSYRNESWQHQVPRFGMSLNTLNRVSSALKIPNDYLDRDNDIVTDPQNNDIIPSFMNNAALDNSNTTVNEVMGNCTEEKNSDPRSMAMMLSIMAMQEKQSEMFTNVKDLVNSVLSNQEMQENELTNQTDHHSNVPPPIPSFHSDFVPSEPSIAQIQTPSPASQQILTESKNYELSKSISMIQKNIAILNQTCEKLHNDINTSMVDCQTDVLNESVSKSASKIGIMGQHRGLVRKSAKPSSSKNSVNILSACNDYTVEGDLNQLTDANGEEDYLNSNSYELTHGLDNEDDRVTLASRSTVDHRQLYLQSQTDRNNLIDELPQTTKTPLLKTRREEEGESNRTSEEHGCQKRLLQSSSTMTTQKCIPFSDQDGGVNQQDLPLNTAANMISSKVRYKNVINKEGSQNMSSVNHQQTFNNYTKTSRTQNVRNVKAIRSIHLATPDHTLPDSSSLHSDQSTFTSKPHSNLESSFEYAVLDLSISNKNKSLPSQDVSSNTHSKTSSTYVGEEINSLRIRSVNEDKMEDGGVIHDLPKAVTRSKNKTTMDQSCQTPSMKQILGLSCANNDVILSSSDEEQESHYFSQERKKKFHNISQKKDSYHNKRSNSSKYISPNGIKCVLTCQTKTLNVADVSSNEKKKNVECTSSKSQASKLKDPKPIQRNQMDTSQDKNCTVPDRYLYTPQPIQSLTKHLFEKQLKSTKEGDFKNVISQLALPETEKKPIKQDLRTPETKPRRRLQNWHQKSKSKFEPRHKEEHINDAYDYLSDTDNEHYQSTPISDISENSLKVSLEKRKSKRTTRRCRIPYSDQEILNLRHGVSSLGTKWQQIMAIYQFHPSRTSIDLKEKFKRLMNQSKSKSCEKKGVSLPFSIDEIRRLKRGVKMFGNNWKAILTSERFLPGRTAIDLRNKWRVINQQLTT